MGQGSQFWVLRAEPYCLLSPGPGGEVGLGTQGEGCLAFKLFI